MGASKKPKFSKNRRKGWRKVNIDEVDKYYDDVRLKERVGQPLDQPNFTIDKKASTHNIASKLSKIKKKKKLLDTSDLTKNILAFQSLKPESAVPPVVVFPKTEAKPEKIKPKEFGKRVKLEQDNWRKNKVYDIWKDESKPARIVKPSVLKRPSILPAIETPHPGMSVNPSLEDHQDLLQKAVDVELEKIRKEKKLKKLLGWQPKKTESQMRKIWLKEMSSGLPGTVEEEESGTENGLEESDDGGLGPIKKIVRAEDRKPKAKRRREMLAKAREAAKKKEKEERKRASQIFQIKRIKKDIVAEEEKLKKQGEKLQRKFAEKATKPARLGPHKYEEPDIPVSLPSELASRLRSVKVEGNLFQERIKSLQKRNIIEPRKLIMKVRGKNFKWSEKRDCREPDKFAHIGKKKV